MNKNEPEMILGYKYRRNDFYKYKRKECACMMQALILNSVETGFYDTGHNLYEQNLYIMNDILRQILGDCDDNYYLGVYSELLACYPDVDSGEQTRKEAEAAKRFTLSDRKEYNLLGLHLTLINSFEDNCEEREVYIHNWLHLLRNREGGDGSNYCRALLHIIGEYLYFSDIKAFYHNFGLYYMKLKKYAAEDAFLYTCILFAAEYSIVSQNGEEERWIKEYDNIAAKIDDEKEKQYVIWKKSFSIGSSLIQGGRGEEGSRLLEEGLRGLEGSVFWDDYLTATALTTLSYYYHTIGRLDTMYKVIQEGLRILERMGLNQSEEYYRLLNNMGLYFCELKKLDQADGYLLRALEGLDKAYGRESEIYLLVKNNIAYVLMEKNKLEKAFAILEELFDIIETSKELENCKELIYTNIVVRIASQDNVNKRMLSKYVGKALNYADAKNNMAMKLKVLCIQGIPFLQSKEVDLGKVQELMQEIEDTERLMVGKLSKEQQSIICKMKTIHCVHLGEWEKMLRKAMEWLALIESGNTLALSQEYLQAVFYNMFALRMLEKYEEFIQIADAHFDRMYLAIKNDGFYNLQENIAMLKIMIGGYLTNISESDRLNVMVDDRSLFEKIVRCKALEKELLQKRNSLFESDRKEESGLWDDIVYKHRMISNLELKLFRLNEEILNSGDDVSDRRIKDRKEQMINKITTLKEETDILQLKLDGIYKAGRLQQDNYEEINYNSLPANAAAFEFFSYYRIDITENNYLCVEENSYNLQFARFVVTHSETGINVIKLKDISREEGDFIIHTWAWEESGQEQEKSEELEQEDWKKISKIILVPFEGYLKGVCTVYWGLDSYLQLLPMEILILEDQYVMDHFINIYISSFPDIEKDFSAAIEESNALVVGNPAFLVSDIQEADTYKQKQAGTGERPLTDSIYQLEHTEEECKMIAEILRVKPCMGTAAKNDVIWNAAGRDIIHISTHGDLYSMVDISYSGEAKLVNSFLIFAGYENWLDKRIDNYGSGIVTADDFSLMNYGQTKLISISACCAGQGVFAGNNSLKGIRWALGVAGARCTVTALWEIDDCAAAVCMVLFYRYLREYPIAAALHYAKLKMRDLCVKEMREDGQLNRIIRDTEITELDDESSPYEDAYYWGAFVCYFN